MEAWARGFAHRGAAEPAAIEGAEGGSAVSCPTAFFWRPAAEPLAVRLFGALQRAAFPIQDSITIRLQNRVV